MTQSRTKDFVVGHPEHTRGRAATVYPRESIVQPRQILIVAHQTACSTTLVAAVRQRAASEHCQFTLLVPASPRGLHRVVDPEDHGRSEARRAIDAARPALEAAAGAPILALVGSHDPLAAVEDAINLGHFDAVIISTLPARVSRWLRFDLPSKIADLGLPTTHVTGQATSLPVAA